MRFGMALPWLDWQCPASHEHDAKARVRGRASENPAFFSFFLAPHRRGALLTPLPKNIALAGFEPAFFCLRAF